jgi:hypothetical protein
MKNNEHVLKYYRWQHFWASEENRPFAQLIWSTAYNTESAEKANK